MKSAAPERGAAGSASKREISHTSVSISPRVPQADLPKLRRIYRRFVARGDRLPPDRGVILREEGKP